jgi:hypothetical protein
MPRHTSHTMGAYDMSPVRETNGAPNIEDVHDVLVEIRDLLREAAGHAKGQPGYVAPAKPSHYTGSVNPAPPPALPPHSSAPFVDPFKSPPRSSPPPAPPPAPPSPPSP